LKLAVLKFLIEKGLYLLRSKPCLFIKWDNKNDVIVIFIIALYIDNILIIDIKGEISKIINIIKEWI